MNREIEQILLARAAQEAESGPKLSDMVALGAAGGAAVGALSGVPFDFVGRGVGKLRGTNRMLKPGARMAGGLVGAILGGGLGAAAQQYAARETGEAGALLAKIQAALDLQIAHLTEHDLNLYLKTHIHNKDF